MNLRSVVTHNLGLKLFALLLAFGIWLLYIPAERTLSEKTLAVPLELRDLPNDLEIVERPVSTIDVTLRAPNRLLNSVTPSDVHAVLDLGKASVYQTGYPLNKSMIEVPPGVEVLEINPNQVTLTLESAREATLPVVPVVIGQPADGYRRAGVAVAPDRVTVRGPESRVRRRGLSVRTSPVDISGMVETGVFEVDLIMPDPDLRVVSGPSRAKVTVTIEPTPAAPAAKPAPPARKK